MGLTATLQLSLNAILSKALDLLTAEPPLSYNKTFTITNGTGANQADQMFHDQRTLSASANEALDLAGVLSDLFGATIALARVKILIVYASPNNTNDVLVGGAASNGFISWVGDATDAVAVKPGGILILVAPNATGYPVTAGSADQLKIANSAGSTSVTYDIVIVGASA